MYYINVLYNIIMEEISYYIHEDYFKGMTLFKGMSLEFFDSIPEIEKVYSMKAGQKLNLNTNKDSYRFDIWIVLQGKITASLSSNEEAIHTIGPGQYFADMEAITGPSDNWILTSLKPTYLIKIPLSIHRIVNVEMQHLLHKIIHSFANYSQEKLKKREHKRIAIIPPQKSGSFNFEEFKRQLHPFIERLDKTLYLTSENMFTMLGVDKNSEFNISNAEIAIRLVNLEIDYDYSIYMLDFTDLKNIEFFLNSADVILFVVDGSGSLELNDLGERCMQVMKSKKNSWESHVALFWKSSACRPNEIAEFWVKFLNAIRVYNLVYDNKADLARLTRLLTDNAIALALGSGAGRGFTHIGIFRVLKEAKIPIDVFCGTSMGALVGAQMAMGKGWHDIMNSLTHVFEELENTPYKFSFSSLIDSKKHYEIAQPYYQNLNIENFNYNFFCVSISLINLKAVIHEFGSATEQINASSALPALFSPIAFKGDLLLDGGVIEPLPIQPLCNRYHPKFIIGIDVSTEVELKFGNNPDYQEASVLQELLYSFLPNTEATGINYPLTDVILRLCEINSSQSRTEIIKNNLVDIYIRPPLEGIATLPNSKEIEAIVEKAYQDFSDSGLKWRDEIAKKVPLFDDLVDY